MTPDEVLGTPAKPAGVAALTGWMYDAPGQDPASRVWCVESVRMVARVYYVCRLKWAQDGKPCSLSRTLSTFDSAVEAAIFEYDRYIKAAAR